MHDRYDAIVIGSGFGGTMAAHGLVNAGLRVLMLERGDWVARGPHNWEPDGSFEMSADYSAEWGYRAEDGREQRAFGCVGGPSVYYGGVSLRLRERDFRPNPGIANGASGAWPFDYAELEPYYARAERLLGVAGIEGATNDATTPDPTAPWRSTPYPHVLPPLSRPSHRVAQAAAGIGLRPFRLPLAINYASSNGRGACIRCLECDTYPCAISAKNDLATTVLPALIANGLHLVTNTVAVKLVERDGRITEVECMHRHTRERRSFAADEFILSAGAIASPHLLLASGLEKKNTAGHAVGRYLMRHCNGIVYGLFTRPPNPEHAFHKQIGIHDFYFGHPSVKRPRGKLGSIQQVHSPPIGLVRLRAPRLLRFMAPPLVERMTGLIVIAEDQPRFENGVRIDTNESDAFGMPRAVIRHHYTRRDRAARRALFRASKRILRAAGAKLLYVHTIDTFSHAVGTVRIGADPATSPLDPEYRFRGVDNLYVVDGSLLPASGGLNPSLTIAANALRAAQILVRSA